MQCSWIQKLLAACFIELAFGFLLGFWVEAAIVITVAAAAMELEEMFFHLALQRFGHSSDLIFSTSPILDWIAVAVGVGIIALFNIAA